MTTPLTSPDINTAKHVNASHLLSMCMLMLLSFFVTSCTAQNKSKVAQTVPQQEPVNPWKQQYYGPAMAPGQVDPTMQISAYIRKVYRDSKGNLWLGTNGDGVCRYNGKKLECFNLPKGFSGYAIRGIVEDNDGNMWFASESGATRYDGKTFTNYTSRDGLISQDLWSLHKDKAGNLWFGSYAGVTRYDGKVFSNFPLPEAGVQNPSFRFNTKLVWSIFEDMAGNMWFGTDGDGVRKFDGKTITVVTTKDGLCSNNIYSIMQDREGNMWFGSRDGGVSRYDGKTFTNLTTADGLSHNFVGSIVQDKTGNMWFGTSGGGACRYNGKTFTNYGAADGLLTHVQSIYEDKSGFLWFGCSGGLFRFDGKSFTNITKNGPWDGC